MDGWYEPCHERRRNEVGSHKHEPPRFSCIRRVAAVFLMISLLKKTQVCEHDVHDKTKYANLNPCLNLNWIYILDRC
ncbi:hypothetical protein I7I53_02122 [Histoplasma capsulatum var. duboisii H88]|uniref:Uncharacterized protein n=1 Tax=Ajellomyces capsulatus (strain H88) TaxID=544711 RepID=A0A8A1LKU5_AJEC8|nr:hypothetical protein I7I53_02122 [Histoplasma capsulatum var. duboisii H88]